jgi:hypothetical protein
MGEVGLAGPSRRGAGLVRVRDAVKECLIRTEVTVRNGTSPQSRLGPEPDPCVRCYTPWPAGELNAARHRYAAPAHPDRRGQLPHGVGSRGVRPGVRLCRRRRRAVGRERAGPDRRGHPRRGRARYRPCRHAELPDVPGAHRQGRSVPVSDGLQPEHDRPRRVQQDAPAHQAVRACRFEVGRSSRRSQMPSWIPSGFRPRSHWQPRSSGSCCVVARS